MTGETTGAVGGAITGAIAREMARELAELQLQLKKRQWLAALRWRRRMKACLAASGISFTEWLVLDATWALVSRTGDSVSQNDVARDIEIDAMTLWHAMAVLDHRGLVSRAGSMSGKARRVFVTSEGVEFLRAVKPGLEAASATAR
ncbi:MAG: MarR family winged helix-turn-helix transcriptional regulator [Pseudomonadota bacterium]